ncbi:hypothetical protein MJO28_005243 [Puccinia striiformis f. sp. tritici]|uniref:F-box domain-containing protein n=2 Tax=Puccinia striiformis TaxID=27350 RepID=A0A2S4W1L4_9BASI|nr:hypothetical protein MJO28_005243 [Puccinia striiformis f. sp. tritici]POW15628.1 hypothetical protein PSTT_02006 [Puccinia striiformis]
MAKITDLPLEVLQVIFHHFSLSLYKAEKAEKEEAEFLDSDRTSEDEISFRASGIDEQAYLPTYHHLAAHRVGCLRLVCRRWAKFLYDTMYFGLTFYSTSQAVAFAKYARKNPQCLRRIKCRYLMFHNVPEAITYKAMRMVIRLLSQTIDTLHIVFSELAAALSDQTVEAIGGMPRLRILKLSNDRYQENEAPRGLPAITHLIATAWYYDIVGLSKALRPALKVLSLEDNSYAINSHALEPVYSNLEEVLEGLEVSNLHFLPSALDITFPQLRVFAVCSVGDLHTFITETLSRKMFTQSPIEILAIGRHVAAKGPQPTFPADPFGNLPKLKTVVFTNEKYSPAQLLLGACKARGVRCVYLDHPHGQISELMVSPIIPHFLS